MMICKSYTLSTVFCCDDSLRVSKGHKKNYPNENTFLNTLYFFFVKSYIGLIPDLSLSKALPEAMN